jgi:outer membrane receptor protein involved in Fe transport
MRRRSTALVAVMLAIVLGGVATDLGAQTETGRISGTVRDPQGGAVPGVTVTLKSTTTDAQRTTVTDSSGNYVLANILPGSYEVSFQLDGFKTVATKAQVAVGEAASVNAALEVGGISEIVSVTAAVERINTRNSELATTITQTQIRELPTITRDPYDMVALAGHVSDQDPTIYSGDTARGVRGFSINGLRATATNALLDGSANNDEFTGAVGQSVPLDSVQEMSVITSNFSAQYGRATAGIVNVVTKAGTNEFHGTAYEFFRNEKLATRTFDQKERGIDKSPFDRHQPGFSLGGPIKPGAAQFFTSLEYTRVRSDATDISWVPTPQFIAQMAPNAQAFFNNYPLGTPINGPVITRGEISGTAGGAFSALPASLPIFGQVQRSLPTDAGGGDPQNSLQFVARGDWTMGPNTQAYARYALEKSEFLVGSNGSSPYAGFDTGEDDRNHNVLFSLTHVWSPRLTSQSKVVFNKLKNVQPLGAQPEGPTLYMRSTATTIDGVRIALPGYLPFTPGSAIPFGGPQNFFQTYQDATFIKGDHDLRFGGSYVRIHDNRTFGAYQNSVQTLGANLGNALDNLVAGRLIRYEGAVDPEGKFPGDTITLPVSQPNFTRNNRYNEWAAYFNDGWQINPRVTLNLGLRYEFYGVQHNSDPSLDSNFYYGPGANLPEQVRNGSVFVASESPVGALWERDRNNFAPRLGFAWDLNGDGRSSIRGGWGMAYERNFGNVTFNVIQNPPNYAVVALNAPSEVPELFITTDNAGPLAGTGSKVLPQTSLRHVDQNIVNAYAHFWSASYQRVLGGTTTVSADYSGSAGVDLYSIERLNIPSSGAVYLGDSDPDAVLNPQYSAINARRNGGKSRYNGIAFAFNNSSLANTGLSMTSRYTLSWNKDNLSSTFSESTNNFNLGLLDPLDPDLDYGRSDADVRHRFSVGGVWAVPFARNASGAVRTIADGWQVAFVVTAQSGSPFTVYDCTNGVFYCIRMLETSAFSTKGAQGTKTGPNTYDYLDLSSQASGVGTYVNPISGSSDFGPFPGNMTKRNAFQRPGRWNADAIFAKRFRMGTTTAAQLRFEMYNVFSHANLYVDGANTDLSASPVIVAFRGDTGDDDGVPQGDGQRRVQIGVKFEF